jgi:hypothetical protein
MTPRIGTMSVDGTPISEADLARIEAEEKLHAEQKRKTVLVVAGCAHDADDCRTLLDMLGLDQATIASARGKASVRRPTAKRSRRRSAA